MIRSYDMGYISAKMMECEDAFSDMGSLKQNLELPPEYAYDDGEKSDCTDFAAWYWFVMQLALLCLIHPVFNDACDCV